MPFLVSLFEIEKGADVSPSACGGILNLLIAFSLLLQLFMFLLKSCLAAAEPLSY